LASRLAEKVLQTGEPELIRKELNSFERRVIHVEVAEVDGVLTDTVEVDGDRKVRLYRADSEEE